MEEIKLVCMYAWVGYPCNVLSCPKATVAAGWLMVRRETVSTVSSKAHLELRQPIWVSWGGQSRVSSLSPTSVP